MFSRRSFAKPLLTWGRVAGRTLPWMTKDPYDVWLSEVMLQQTQVATILTKFPAFKARFPTLAALAASSVDDVLAEWSGLGYYRRARNLHACARQLQDYVQAHGGYPKDPEVWASFPGIGKSTSHAIVSACFGVVVPILDANARRVLLRFAGEPEATPKQAWAHAYVAMKGISSAEAPSYTQAIMDLGATVCTAKKPKCAGCPVQSSCGYTAAPVDAVPKVMKKQPKPVAHLDWALLYDAQERVAMVQNDELSIWPGLWRLPLLSELALVSEQATLTRSFTHTLSHRTLSIHVWELSAEVTIPTRSPVVWVRKQDIELKNVATPTPVRNILRS